MLLGSLQGCFPVVAAGVGTGALMASDRRTTGTYIEDEGIEDKAGYQVSLKYQDKAHVNVTSYNRHVLLTGEVPDEQSKTDIAKIVAGVMNVKAVSNELVVSGKASFTSRSSDTIITGDVKLRFINNKVFEPDHVKVITESGVVYLMGLVYHKEADAAADIASTTNGVLRVVKVFEYLD
ncbi:MAG: BON domain-containing protein [Nitrosomonadales bacterium]